VYHRSSQWWPSRLQAYLERLFSSNPLNELVGYDVEEAPHVHRLILGATLDHKLVPRNSAGARGSHQNLPPPKPQNQQPAATSRNQQPATNSQQPKHKSLIQNIHMHKNTRLWEGRKLIQLKNFFLDTNVILVQSHGVTERYRKCPHIPRSDPQECGAISGCSATPLNI